MNEPSAVQQENLLNNVKKILEIVPYITDYPDVLTREEELKSAKILQQISLGKIVGSGAFGYVFEIKNSNKMIKIAGIATQQDEKRYCEMMDKMFSGIASLEDMHYFDYGKLGDNSGLTYLIMPKVVPLQKSPLYVESRVFFYTASAIAWVTQRLAARSAKPYYEPYKAGVLDKAFAMSEYG